MDDYSPDILISIVQNSYSTSPSVKCARAGRML
jgi:hypothetical protein